MSRHVCKPEENIEVHMGYDRPLSRLYLTIYDASNPDSIIYDDLDDESCDPFTDFKKPVTSQLSHFQMRIKEVGGSNWNIPEEFYIGVIDDAMHQRCNAETKTY